MRRIITSELLPSLFTSGWYCFTLARKAALSSRDEQFGSTPRIEYGEELESGSSLFLLSLQLGMNRWEVEFLELERKETFGIEGDTRKHSIVLCLLRILSVSYKLQCSSNRILIASKSILVWNRIKPESKRHESFLLIRCSPHSSDVEKLLYSPDRELCLSTFPIGETEKSTITGVLPLSRLQSPRDTNGIKEEDTRSWA